MLKLLSLFLLLPFALISQTNPEWKTLSSLYFTILYPATWQLDQSDVSQSSILFYSPLESSDDQFKENVNILIKDLSATYTDIKKFAEQSENQIKAMITNANILESNQVKLGKKTYHKIIYVGDFGPFHLKYEQYYYVEADKAYVLTFTSEQDKYESFKAIGEKILDSFTIK